MDAEVVCCVYTLVFNFNDSAIQGDGGRLSCIMQTIEITKLVHVYAKIPKDNWVQLKLLSCILCVMLVCTCHYNKQSVY